MYGIIENVPNNHNKGIVTGTPDSIISGFGCDTKYKVIKSSL